MGLEKGCRSFAELAKLRRVMEEPAHDPCERKSIGGWHEHERRRARREKLTYGGGVCRDYLTHCRVKDFVRHDTTGLRCVPKF